MNMAQHLLTKPKPKAFNKFDEPIDIPDEEDEERRRALMGKQKIPDESSSLSNRHHIRPRPRMVIIIEEPDQRPSSAHKQD